MCLNISDDSIERKQEIQHTTARSRTICRVFISRINTVKLFSTLYFHDIASLHIAYETSLEHLSYRPDLPVLNRKKSIRCVLYTQLNWFLFSDRDQEASYSLQLCWSYTFWKIKILLVDLDSFSAICFCLHSYS